MSSPRWRALGPGMASEASSRRPRSVERRSRVGRLRLANPAPLAASGYTASSLRRGRPGRDPLSQLAPRLPAYGPPGYRTAAGTDVERSDQVVQLAVRRQRLPQHQKASDSESGLCIGALCTRIRGQDTMPPGHFPTPRAGQQNRNTLLKANGPNAAPILCLSTSRVPSLHAPLLCNKVSPRNGEQ